MLILVTLIFRLSIFLFFSLYSEYVNILPSHIKKMNIFMKLYISNTKRAKLFQVFVFSLELFILTFFLYDAKMANHERESITIYK